MHQWLEFAGWAAMAAALCGIGYAATAVWVANWFRAPVEKKSVAYPPVTLLKPLHLDEPLLRQNLESFCRQDYPAPMQIVFGVQDPLDPAIRIVEALKRDYPHLDIELVVDTRIYGTNRKVSNLINLVERAKYDVLVQSDSDIAVEPDYLLMVTASLENSEGGAVTCLYTGTALPNIWSRLVAMGINYQFIPNVLVGTHARLATPCFGSTIALRKELLLRIGGMKAFSDLLADDYEIGRAVRESGFGMTVAPVVVAHTCAEASAHDMLAHELRWARTIRLLNTRGYWGSIITHTFPLALLGAALVGFHPYALALVATTLVARLAVKWRMDWVLGTSAGPAWLLPLRDLLSFAIFLGSLFGGNVRWRGTRFLVAPDGVLSHW